MSGTNAGGVVLLHGHGRVGASMRRLAAAARANGYATFIPRYPYRRSMDGILDDLVPRIEKFAAGFDGPLHFVTHSLGGLVARAYLAVDPSPRVGRVVMLGPPNGGSELADLLMRWRLDGILLGRAGLVLRTLRNEVDERALGKVGFDLGVIAGDRALDPVLPRLLLPRPNDGKVSVAATRLDGMRDHLVLPVSHTLMVYDRRVIRQVIAFLGDGQFHR